MMDGTDLSPWMIRYGYECAAFPMTMESGEIAWFRPRDRALFPLAGIHVSRSLARVIRSQRFVITFDQEFELVMRGCFRPEGNWLSERFVQVYGEVHRQGWAHSCEVWLDDRLVGGTYGLALGSCFCAESMFHRETDASKVALWAMVEKCRSLGFTVFDAQIMNPHLASLGAFEVSAAEYEELLADALTRTTPWSAAQPVTRPE